MCPLTIEFLKLFSGLLLHRLIQRHQQKFNSFNCNIESIIQIIQLNCFNSHVVVIIGIDIFTIA